MVVFRIDKVVVQIVLIELLLEFVRDFAHVGKLVIEQARFVGCLLFIIIIAALAVVVVIGRGAASQNELAPHGCEQRTVRMLLLLLEPAAAAALEPEAASPTI